MRRSQGHPHPPLPFSHISKSDHIPASTQLLPHHHFTWDFCTSFLSGSSPGSPHLLRTQRLERSCENVSQTLSLFLSTPSHGSCLTQRNPCHLFLHCLSHLIPFAYSTPAPPASLLFLKCIWHVSTPGHLHLLLPLPRYPHGFFPYFRSLPKCCLPREAFLVKAKLAVGDS